MTEKELILQRLYCIQGYLLIRDLFQLCYSVIILLILMIVNSKQKL